MTTDPRFVEEATQRHEATIALDLGGTWFRGGVHVAPYGLIAVHREPAINYISRPGASTQELQEALADFAASEVRRLRAEFPQYEFRSVGVSIGGAVDSNTGIVLNSGPLWGGRSMPFDLAAALRARDHSVEWNVINDVTAAALYYADQHKGDGLAALSVITVSTGIACRKFDYVTGAVPTGPTHGLQGEIGHLPITFQFRGKEVHLTCDCGGANHLNAFSSGRGVNRLLGELANDFASDQSSRLLQDMREAPDAERLEVFLTALRGSDRLATEILNAVTAPIAQSLLNMFTLDPQLDRIIITGGLVHTLGALWMESLLGHLHSVGLYQVTDREPDFFQDRLRVSRPDDNAELCGAVVAAIGWPTSQMPTATRGRVFDSTDVDGKHSWTVAAHLPIRYRIVEAPHLFAPESRLLLQPDGAAGATPRRRLAVIDGTVDELYGERIESYFGRHGIPLEKLVLVSAESKKNIESVLRAVEAMERLPVPRRQDPILAIGGGTLLDVVGMAASLYRRGVPYIRIPTTLLSLVDASVGAKVGVNFSGRKNLIGGYFPPLATYLDSTFLITQDDRQVRSGLAEILKVALVRDSKLFRRLEDAGAGLIKRRLQHQADAEVWRYAIRGMLEELAPNLWEHDLRRRMDFGHSFSPALEMMTGAGLLHGEAVAIDMAISVAIARGRGLLSETDARRILGLMIELGLPLMHESASACLFFSALGDASLHRDDAQRLPLPTGIGTATFVNDVTSSEVQHALESLRRSYVD